jgi:hypothetical protein
VRPNEEPNDDRGARRDEDTEAILRRRKFLIQSALAGAGLGALLAGCEAEPKVCLEVTPDGPNPNICLQPPKVGTKAGPKPGTEAAPKLKTDAAARTCLSVPPEPGPCLKLPAPRTHTGAKVCLKLAPPKKPKPRVCLSLPTRQGDN